MSESGEKRALEVEEYNNAKRKYFSDFALRHLSSLRFHKQGGVLGKENKSWRNVSEHCLMEGVVADIIAEAVRLPNRESLVKAALLHDWFKRQEIEKAKASGPGQQGAAVVLAGEEDQRLLVQAGVPAEVISLAHANVPRPGEENSLSQRTMAEKIIHWVDLSTQETVLVDFRDRLKQGNSKPVNRAFSEFLRTQYGGKSLEEVHLEASVMEQAEIEQALGISEGSLISWINEKLQERIKQKSKL